MTRDEIIKMAREVGIIVSRAVENVAWVTDLPDLERFAKLVAAAEREARVKAIENSIDGLLNNSDWADGYIQAAKDIADGIRARGNS